MQFISLDLASVLIFRQTTRPVTGKQRDSANTSNLLGTMSQIMIHTWFRPNRRVHRDNVCYPNRTATPTDTLRMIQLSTCLFPPGIS
jgi:hypothetical protein